MRTTNYTDLRANLKGYIDSVVDDCDTVIINRGNGTGVVMISLEEYNSLKETEYIMSSPQTMEDIYRGEEDLKAGKGIEVDLDSL
ncbi:type II toxin-antitoxin system Phd/YefM family antitoxin [Bacteroides sp. UBA939]|uniref:type II toxin-antitoxin system Phd/YefM family antitoxin n=1 Tax=Bacteroides sp. UBA939 TaxID=1946092 RepID=UPI0025B91E94|nr:type II toxin-antitoxin system prevent-host-death family antitoxin [Bacteroides sp. UBA939]